MTRTYSAKEIAADAGVPDSRVTWLTSIGLLAPDERGDFTFGAVFAVRLVSALLDAGTPEAIIERTAAEGWLNFDGIDDRLPNDPGPRSRRTFAEFQAEAGPRASLLPAVYEVLGLPEPDPSGPIHRDEESMFQGFLAGWQAADDDSLLRAARLIAGGTRAATLGWSELFDEQIAGPARERMLRGEIDQFPAEARATFATLVRVAPQMFTWLSTRYLEQRATVSIVDGFERFLASRNLAPDPEAPAPPAIVFVDLSGFTRLTEERGDETAVRTAASLQREADAAATRHGGRLVKLLGDGAMLRFTEPLVGTKAALDLVETMSGQGALSAHAGVHAGPVIERDLDVFGRTVNLASHIADVAQAGEVLASGAVVDAVRDAPLGFEPLEEVTLKGIPEPMSLYRVTRREAGRPR